jgi:serine/threonine-protein kinase
MNARAKAKLPEVLPGMDVGGYTVRAKLGSGSFGTVYAAERGGVLYALKLLPLEGLGPWGERELSVLARVNHPNAVRLRGFAYWPDAAPRFFVVVMQYEEGRRLDVWARTENPCARDVVRRVLDVARALVAVHEEKALHRDVKEANIIVREADGSAVLVDFGVGSYEGTSRITGGALPPGTRNYLSPEAWRFQREQAGRPEAHHASTPADDLYALGVTLYWLLTDAKPFTIEMQGDEEAVLTREPTPPHVRNPRVPPELGELCVRLLAKSPEARPEARALCVALEELQALRGAAWEVPLCDFHEAHNVTTLPGEDADDLGAWFKEAREDGPPPRRGRRPSQVEPSVDPASEEVQPQAEDACEATTPTPTPPGDTPAAVRGARLGVADLGPPLRAPRGRSRARAVLGLALVLALAVGALAAGVARRALAVAPSPAPAMALGMADARQGGKVAPPGEPPEAQRAAVPPDADSTPATGALRALPPQETAPVKTPSPQQRKQPAPRLGAVGKALTLATCSALAGCTSGPPVRPAPPSAPCPAGAVETMEDKLGIRLGSKFGVTFPVVGESHPVAVREGLNSIRLDREWGKLPSGTVVTVNLFFADRIYGRVTHARTPQGDTFPVCMELLDTGHKRGLEREPNGDPNTVKVYSEATLKPVEEFE